MNNHPIICDSPGDLRRIVRRLSALAFALDVIVSFGHRKMLKHLAQIGGMIGDYTNIMEMTLDNLREPLNKAFNYGGCSSADEFNHTLELLRDDKAGLFQKREAVERALVEINFFFENDVEEMTRLRTKLEEAHQKIASKYMGSVVNKSGAADEVAANPAAPESDKD